MTHRYRRKQYALLTPDERAELFRAIEAEEEFEAAEWWIMGVPEPVDPPPAEAWDDDEYAEVYRGQLCPHGFGPDECEQCDNDLPF